MATQTYDDRDPAVVYSSGWGTAGSSSEYQGTTTFAGTPGRTARFTFRGTVVAVYGTIGALHAPESSYSVDGGTPVVFRATRSNDARFGSRFFQSSPLSNGQHTLTVTSLGNFTLFLDSFTVLTPDVPSPSSSSLVAAPTSSTSIAPNRGSSTIDPASSSVAGQSSSSVGFVTVVVTSLSVGASSSATPDANPGGTASTSKANNIPIIAGSCIGASLGIFLLCFIAFILLRRQKRREENSRVVSAFYHTPPPGTVSSNRTVMSQVPVTPGGSSPGPYSPSRSTYYNYPTSSRHSAQEAYANNAFIEHLLQRQQVPYRSSAMTPYQIHGYDHHTLAALPPPDYPSSEYPLYGQRPFANPGGYALPSKLLNEYQNSATSGTAASNGQQVN